MRPASTAPGPSRRVGLRVAVVERELVGGECSYWACIPPKSLLRPGEAVQGARDVRASAEVNVQAALDWRDYMVSGYSDARQEKCWRIGYRADPGRGPARRARRGRCGRYSPHGGASGSRRSVSRQNPHGVVVDEYLRAGDNIWAIGDVIGIWPLTHVGEYEGDVVAANIAGESHPTNYEAVPRVRYTDPQAAAVGAAEAPYSSTTLLTGVSKTATYSHLYAQSNGFLTLLSDGARLTGAYALGAEAGWLQQATLAIRGRVPLEVLSDVIQPFPSFSTNFDSAFKTLRMEIAKMPPPLQPTQAQMARL